MTQQPVQFGWVLPAQANPNTPAPTFVNQVFNAIDEIHQYYDTVWMPDHFHPPMPNSDPHAHVLECLTTLAHISGRYPDLTVGSIVLGQSYRNPALMAKMAATLQTLTGGRFILGLGAGWKQDEYTAYNYPYPKASVRIAELAEAVQIIKAMWASSPASFQGEHHQIDNAYCLPSPQPRPPIMIGGGGEKLTLRVVAEHADWWNYTFSDVATCAHKLNILQQHCDAVGRDFNTIVKTWRHIIAVAETETHAQTLAQDFPQAIVGTPEQVTEQLQVYVDLGISHFMVSFPRFPDMESAHLFAEQVIPALR